MAEDNTNLKAELRTSSGAAAGAAAMPKESRPTSAKNKTKSPAPTAAASSTGEQAQPVTQSRSGFGKLVPILVLSLAAVILFGISGSWNAWTADQSVQKIG